MRLILRKVFISLAEDTCSTELYGTVVQHICESYVTYVRSKYLSNDVTVFDEYPEDKTVEVPNLQSEQEDHRNKCNQKSYLMKLRHHCLSRKISNKS